MSWWTYVTGVVKVDVVGYTQKHKDYILDMVLKHLPKVTGSEGNMEIYITQRQEYNMFTNHDEFDTFIQEYPHDMEMQSQYMITVCGSLRDRKFSQTYREVVRWLTRLSKRIDVEDVLIKVYDPYENESIITDKNNTFSDMYEWGSWCKDSNGIPNWAEFMLWDTDGIDNYPLMLLAREGDKNALNELNRRRIWRENNRRTTKAN